jgi:Zn-dependent membrane protease YugP
MGGMTGAEAARTLLAYNGLSEVKIEGAKGQLTDHYDPRHKVLRLSSDVARNPSVAALGIVAHEVGHAVQDNLGYAPLRVRSALVPAANLGSRFGFICVILGLILYMFGAGFGLNIMWIGIFLFAAAVLFALVTLPVEYDASTRARLMLKSTGLVSAREYDGASAVLSAAALTYVAALLQAIAQLFYFVLLALGMGRR